jgi:hypothetical protein
MEYALGDLVQMKKPHPCGANRWRVIRTGMDVKIKCLGCGHIVMLSHEVFIKRLKRILPDEKGKD